MMLFYIYNVYLVNRPLLDRFGRCSVTVPKWDCSLRISRHSMALCFFSCARIPFFVISTKYLYENTGSNFHEKKKMRNFNIHPCCTDKLSSPRWWRFHLNNLQNYSHWSSRYHLYVRMSDEQLLKFLLWVYQENENSLHYANQVRIWKSKWLWIHICADPSVVQVNCADGSHYKHHIFTKRFMSMLRIIA